MLDGPDALCFDVYGTLCDTQAVTAELHDRIDAPSPVVEKIARRWRDTQLEYTFRVEVMDAYRPFTELTADALEFATAYYGHEIDEEGTEALLDAYDELDPYEGTLDALDALGALGEGGLDLVAFSNGNHGMLDPVLENAGIDERLDGIVSADEVGTFKPDPVAYDHAASEVGHELGDCWLVSSNRWDVVGAIEAGMGAAWVNRDNEPYDPVGGSPSLSVDSLGELAAELAGE
jgi:2-haloacid dehalogenase